MKKTNYISPDMTHVELAAEALCIASSATEETGVDSGIAPEPWQEGNTNWW